MRNAENSSLRAARGWVRAAAVAVAAVGLLAVATAGAARAEGDPRSDIEDKIRKQMQHIRELMEANEKALFELSTGKDAKPREVDVTLPPPDGASGSSGSEGASGAGGSGSSGSGSTGGSGASGAGAGDGDGAVRKIEEIVKDLEQAASGTGGGGGMIPDELKKLVEMIPT